MTTTMISTGEIIKVRGGGGGGDTTASSSCSSSSSSNDDDAKNNDTNIIPTNDNNNTIPEPFYSGQYCMIDGPIDSETQRWPIRPLFAWKDPITGETRRPYHDDCDNNDDDKENDDSTSSTSSSSPSSHCGTILCHLPSSMFVPIGPLDTNDNHWNEFCKLRRLAHERSCTNCHVEFYPQYVLCCTQCQNTYYCSTKCQKEHWSIHKQTCHAAVSEKRTDAATTTSTNKVAETNQPLTETSNNTDEDNKSNGSNGNGNGKETVSSVSVGCRCNSSNNNNDDDDDDNDVHDDPRRHHRRQSKQQRQQQQQLQAEQLQTKQQQIQLQQRYEKRITKLMERGRYEEAERHKRYMIKEGLGFLPQLYYDLGYILMRSSTTRLSSMDGGGGDDNTTATATTKKQSPTPDIMAKLDDAISMFQIVNDWDQHILDGKDEFDLMSLDPIKRQLYTDIKLDAMLWMGTCLFWKQQYQESLTNFLTYLRLKKDDLSPDKLQNIKSMITMVQQERKLQQQQQQQQEEKQEGLKEVDDKLSSSSTTETNKTKPAGTTTTTTSLLVHSPPPTPKKTISKRRKTTTAMLRQNATMPTL